MEVALIGDSATVLGFQLAGIRLTFTPASDPELSEIIRDLTRREDIGLLIITERMAEKVEQKIREVRQENPRLIVVEIPDYRGPVSREADPIQDLLRRALGAQIKT